MAPQKEQTKRPSSRRTSLAPQELQDRGWKDKSSPGGCYSNLERMRTCAPVVLAASFLLLGGCDVPTEPVACIAIAKAGVTVVVADAATGEPLCDAAVTITSGAFQEVLHALPLSGSCSYSGAYERPGVYMVAATRSGYRGATAGPLTVEMSREPCPHVINQSATLLLERAP